VRGSIACLDCAADKAAGRPAKSCLNHCQREGVAPGAVRHVRMRTAARSDDVRCLDRCAQRPGFRLGCGAVWVLEYACGCGVRRDARGRSPRLVAVPGARRAGCANSVVTL
jgi:hypothetical protein